MKNRILIIIGILLVTLLVILFSVTNNTPQDQVVEEDTVEFQDVDIDYEYNFVSEMLLSRRGYDVETGEIITPNLPMFSECGNGIVEAGEECDGELDEGLSCSQWGYTGGVLSCGEPGTLLECRIITENCTLNLESEQGRRYLEANERTIEDFEEVIIHNNNNNQPLETDDAGCCCTATSSSVLTSSECNRAGGSWRILEEYIPGTSESECEEYCNTPENNDTVNNTPPSSNPSTPPIIGGSVCEEVRVCGDGILQFNAGEECDGNNLQGFTCEYFGIYSGGTLGCYPKGHERECAFDYSNCVMRDIDNPGGPVGPVTEEPGYVKIKFPDIKAKPGQTVNIPVYVYQNYRTGYIPLELHHVEGWEYTEDGFKIISFDKPYLPPRFLAQQGVGTIEQQKDYVETLMTEWKKFYEEYENIVSGSQYLRKRGVKEQRWHFQGTNYYFKRDNYDCKFQVPVSKRNSPLKDEYCKIREINVAAGKIYDELAKKGYGDTFNAYILGFKWDGRYADYKDFKSLNPLFMIAYNPPVPDGQALQPPPGRLWAAGASVWPLVGNQILFTLTLKVREDASVGQVIPLGLSCFRKADDINLDDFPEYPEMFKRRWENEGGVKEFKSFIMDGKRSHTWACDLDIPGSITVVADNPTDMSSYFDPESDHDGDGKKLLEDCNDWDANINTGCV